MPLLPRSTHLPRLATSLVALLGTALSVGACRFEEPRDDGQGGAGGSGSGGASEAAPLTVVTWNVHNLINDKLDADLEFEDVDPDYDAHRVAVAKVIDELAADVVVLQEVEHAKVLDELNQALAAPYPHQALIEGNDPRGVY